MSQPLFRRAALRSAAALAGLPLLACEERVRLGQDAVAGQTPDGTVELEEVQLAYLGSGNAGRGTLNFRGRSYPFTIGGLGVGGIGASTLRATGEVYDLRDISRFPGAYGETRRGFVIGERGRGDLWMQNAAGVIMHLKAHREGLMLSFGADAIVISMSA